MPARRRKEQTEAQKAATGLVAAAAELIGAFFTVVECPWDRGIVCRLRAVQMGEYEGNVQAVAQMTQTKYRAIKGSITGLELSKLNRHCSPETLSALIGTMAPVLGWGAPAVIKAARLCDCALGPANEPSLASVGFSLRSEAADGAHGSRLSMGDLRVLSSHPFLAPAAQHSAALLLLLVEAAKMEAATPQQVKKSTPPQQVQAAAAGFIGAFVAVFVRLLVQTGEYKAAAQTTQVKSRAIRGSMTEHSKLNLNYSPETMAESEYSAPLRIFRDALMTTIVPVLSWSARAVIKAAGLFRNSLRPGAEPMADPSFASVNPPLPQNRCFSYGSL